ncbi:ABC transporter substrate-binding protein [Falsiroseomonas sp. HW251]|uniref:ABC transporter substrate-binding protein n=1 Tax=Falsiroseomonas sp. HW251 TaxID=3390998 RepID=UPI003D322C41
MDLSRRRLLGGAIALPAPAMAQARAQADVVRVAVLAPRGVGSPDPHRATAHPDRMLASWVHGALVRFRPGTTSPATIEPDLAEAWEHSPDRRTWHFRLREGVAFHRGFGPVTAEDVAFSLRRAADPAISAHAGDLATLEEVAALDARTVRVVWRAAPPVPLGPLANYAGGFILSHRAMEAGGAEAATVGFGPFAVAEHQAGQSMRLVAHAGYFRGPPKLAGIAYRFVASPATADLAFQANEVDVVEGQADGAWIARQRAGGAVVDVIEPAELSQLHLNVTRAPLDDPRVRRAVALAVNRAELARWRGDLARAAGGVVPSGALGFAGDAALPGPDPEAARRLLAEAGHPNGITLRTVHTSNAGMLGAIQVVQAQLRRAGITLDIEVVDHLTWHAMIRQDLSPVVHYAAARFPVADATLTPFFHSRGIVGAPGAATNFSHCAVADAEIDAARAEPEEAAQARLWAEAQRKILAAGCAVPLVESMAVWARRPGFDYGFAFRGAMATGPLITEQARFG